jgi:hypothetical protein
MTSGEADIVWHAIVFHDGRHAVTERAGPEALLVAAGAASDVDGPDEDAPKEAIDEIVKAFPRLRFKARFTQLAIDHCVRKPLSQRGTWLEGLCREHSPGAFKPSDCSASASSMLRTRRSVVVTVTRRLENRSCLLNSFLANTTR